MTREGVFNIDAYALDPEACGPVFEDRGMRQLKGVPDGWRVFAAVG